MRRRLAIVAVAAITVAIAVVGCSDGRDEIAGPPVPTATPLPSTTPTVTPVPTPSPTPTPDDRIDAANELLASAELDWRRSGITHYRYTLHRSCECDLDVSAPRVITVYDGEVVEAIALDSPSPHGGYTAEDFFALARAALIEGKRVDMTHDGNGFPTSGVIDVEATWVDGGFVYETSDFEVLTLGPVRTPVTPDADVEPTPDVPAAICDAIAAIEDLDDPQTPEQARQMLAEMRRQADVILESAPPELQSGAAELVTFFVQVSDLAEAADWSPEFLEDLDDEDLAGAGIDIETVLAFAATLEAGCSS